MTTSQWALASGWRLMLLATLWAATAAAGLRTDVARATPVDEPPQTKAPVPLAPFPAFTLMLPLASPPPAPVVAIWPLGGPSVHGWTLDRSTATTAPARTGHDVLQAFHDGLAAPGCDDVLTQPRWRRHFAHAPALLADDDRRVLDLFAHVVNALRQAHLPTEFALIPFVESGYRPEARSAHGPAGLWQFVAVTARHHRIAIRPGHDGRLSAVESTRAAVRYLKTLYGMFGGDWRLAVMAFNAGEHRILRAMRKAGMSATNARPAELPGLAPVTLEYVEKLHALACVIDEAGQDPQWRGALDRDVRTLD